jgi:dTDP-4-dehydrorhamnose reductase
MMRVLLTGASGLLGHALRVELPAAGMSIIPLTKSDLDITDGESVVAAIERTRPDVVLNCAAYTQVDAAEANEAAAMRVNAGGALRLAETSDKYGIRIVYPSTDYVFAGDRQRAWLPSDDADPVNAYGRSKLAGERAVQSVADHLIVRTSWLFGGGGPNFVRTVVSRLEKDAPLRVVNDQTGRPTYTTDLARAIAQLLLRGVPAGVYHVANAGAATWFELAGEIARVLGKSGLVTSCRTDEFPRPAARPVFSVLDSTHTDGLIGTLRPWREALTEAIHAKNY